MNRIWIVLAGFAVIVAVGLAIEDKPPAPAAPLTMQRMTRDAFLEACRIDRQIEACARALGNPDSRQSNSDRWEAWYYAGRTFDPVTKRPDMAAQVIVENGVVQRINFQ